MADLAKIQPDTDSEALTAPAPGKFGNPRPIMREIGPPAPSADAAEFGVALVRGPILSTHAAFNNEATPAIGLAFISGYLKKHGYNPVIVDAVGEGLNVTWQPEGIDGYQCQGTTIENTVAMIPDHVRVIGFSTMFSGLYGSVSGWPRAASTRHRSTSIPPIRAPKYSPISGNRE